MDPFTDKSWDLSATLGSDYRVCGSPNPDVECLGHHAGDLTYWATVSLDSTGAYVKSYLTNQEVQAAALPRSSDYSLPYIYNHFEWSHCSEVGVDFKAVNAEEESYSSSSSSTPRALAEVASFSEAVAAAELHDGYGGRAYVGTTEGGGAQEEEEE